MHVRYHRNSSSWPACLARAAVAASLLHLPRALDVLAPRAASAQPPAALPAATPHHVTVTPGTPVTFRLEPSAPFIDVSVTFDGAEVVATLRPGGAALVTARLPERTRGRMTVAAEVSNAGAGGAGGESGTTLTVEVASATMSARRRSRSSGAAARRIRPSRERAAVQREIYTAIGEWWDGSRETREAAAARLAKCLDRIRALQSPALLYDALIVLGAVHVDLANREPALAAASEAVDLARASGDESNEALALLKTAIARSNAGEPEAAAELARQVIAMRQRLNGGKGDPRGEADALIALAGIQSTRSANDDAAGGAGAGGAAGRDRRRPAAAGRDFQSARRDLWPDRTPVRGSRGLRARADPAPPGRRSSRHRADLEQSRRRRPATPATCAARSICWRRRWCCAAPPEFPGRRQHALQPGQRQSRSRPLPAGDRSDDRVAGDLARDEGRARRSVHARRTSDRRPPASAIRSRRAPTTSRRWRSGSALAIAAARRSCSIISPATPSRAAPSTRPPPGWRSRSSRRAPPTRGASRRTP